jgi:membrane protease YdiL (CAAX protease family)
LTARRTGLTIRARANERGRWGVRAVTESLAAQPQKAAELRHFVFAPGGPAARNGVAYYALSFAAFLALAVALQAAVSYLIQQLSLDNKALRAAIASLSSGEHRPWRLYFLLGGISYLTLWISLGIAVPVVHKRALRTLFTDRTRFAFRRAVLGFLLYTAILAGPFVVYVTTTHTGLKPHFNPAQFAQLLVFSAALFAIQTTTEELIFRGYLTQFVASITDMRALIVLLPSILFMLSHFDNPEVVRSPNVFVFYFAFGVFMALIVQRERGLELTIGAHFANNLINAVLVRPDNSIFETPAIFVLPPPGAQSTQGFALFSLTFTPALYWLLTSLIPPRPLPPPTPTKA